MLLLTENLARFVIKKNYNKYKIILRKFIFDNNPIILILFDIILKSNLGKLYYDSDHCEIVK